MVMLFSGFFLPKCRLGGVVGLSLAFCTQDCGLDRSPNRWIFLMKKTYSGHVCEEMLSSEERTAIVSWKLGGKTYEAAPEKIWKTASNKGEYEATCEQIQTNWWIPDAHQYLTIPSRDSVA
ncbi:hypothetical protein TNCV_3808091 [Trichonephila clavipes]|nr:hypothetical protein TNCV_3808091 [Trichonephila clavipes]